MANTQKNMDYIHQMVMDDGRLTVNHIANVMSIFHKRMENILHKDLGVSKVLAQWVPWLLTLNQKLTRLVRSKANLAMFEADKDGFVKCFLTQHECRVYHFEAETKQQSMQ